MHTNNTKKESYTHDVEKTCIGPRRRKSVCALAITSSSSLGMWGMEQAARKSSTWHATVGRIAKVPSPTSASKLLWSIGGSTEWRRMRLTFEECNRGLDTRCRCLAAIAVYAHQLVGIACGRFHAESSDSPSARGSGARRVCANFRVWVLRGLYCLQTTTMFRSRYEWIRANSHFCWLKKFEVIFLWETKDTFPWDELQSGLGAKYLSAVVLAHHNHALSRYRVFSCVLFSVL